MLSEAKREYVWGEPIEMERSKIKHKRLK